MSDETFYLKIESSPEQLEAWLGEVSIPSIYYRKLLTNQKGLMWCSNIRLRKIPSDDGGYVYFLIFAEYGINSFVSNSYPYFETSQEEIPFGYLNFIKIDENHQYVVGYRHHIKWLKIIRRLFVLLRTKYRPGESNLKMTDEQDTNLGELTKRKTVEKKRNRSSEHYSFPANKRQEIANEYRKFKKENETTNMDAFAGKYGISGRTLRNYLKENPE